MNDIELIGSGNKFDWNFTDTDLVDVNGDARLVSAIRHTILLQRRELEQELYNTKGNRLHEIIKSEDINSANTLTLIATTTTAMATEATISAITISELQREEKFQ